MVIHVRSKKKEGDRGSDSVNRGEGERQEKWEEQLTDAQRKHLARKQKEVIC